MRDYNQLEESHAVLTPMNIYWSSLTPVLLLNKTKKHQHLLHPLLILLFQDKKTPKINQSDAILEG